MLAAFTFAVLALQEPAPAVALFRRGDAGPAEGLKGALEKVAADGTLTVRVEGAGVIEVPVEDLDRLVVAETGRERRADPDRMELAAADPLRRGGALTGTLKGFDGARFTMSTVFGDVTIARERVRTITFTKRPTAPSAGAGDGVSTRADTRRGRLVSIDAEAVVVKQPDGAEARLPRADVHAVELEREGTAAPAAHGIFARLDLAGGGMVVATLKGYADGALRVFSPHFGEASVPLKSILRVSAVDRLAFRHGRIVIGSWRQLRELEIPSEGPQLRQLWSHQIDSLQVAQSIVRLADGNFLLADMQTGAIMEVRPPRGGTAGETLYEASGLSNPSDLWKLAKDRYVVCERGSGKLVELVADGARGREIDLGERGQALQVKPTADGSMAVLTNKNQIVELKSDLELGKAVAVQGVNAARMEILETGHYLLLSEGNPGTAWEVTPEGKVVWELKNLSNPVGVARMDDGHTLVAEQGKNSLVEYDAAGNALRSMMIDRNNYFQQLTYY